MTKPTNIGILISGALDGNLKCQRSLFMEHYDFVFHICERYLGTNGQTKETSNDVFLKVFDKLHIYDKRLPFRSWISRITINTCIDVIRKEKRALQFEEIKDFQIGEWDNDLESYLDQEVELLPIIKELPPQYRLVFNLYVMEEYKHHEIAEKLNISVGTSKSNLSRAKKILIEQIEKNPKYVLLKQKVI